MIREGCLVFTCGGAVARHYACVGGNLPELRAPVEYSHTQLSAVRQLVLCQACAESCKISAWER
jgi:hypothetical protein